MAKAVLRQFVGLAFGLTVGFIDPTTVGAETFAIDYNLSLAGIPLGKASVSGDVDNKRYKLEARLRFTGLAGVIVDAKGAAAANGSVGQGGAISPNSFLVKAKAGADERIIRMNMSRGNATGIDISPPLDLKPDHVPVKSEHKRGVVDPLSAILMPVSTRRDPMDPENCNRTLPVFDGGARIDIVLSYSRTQDIDTNAYKGHALVCAARYVPLAGYRPNRKVIKYMEDNRDMWVWLVPIDGTSLLMPLRVQVKTTLGDSLVEAAKWRKGTASGK